MDEATREPTPQSHSKRVQIGDVAFIREGCLYLLFSAGCPLGERQLGIDVPPTFKQLDIGEIGECDPLEAGYLCTNGVQETSSSPPLTSASLMPPPPVSPYARSFIFVSSSTSDLNFSTLISTSSISFELTGEKGAILLTKHPIYREDARRLGTFEKYAKEHYTSWVAFAQETGYGDVSPVLITGVNRTKDWAMLCYSNNAGVLKCKFTTSIPEAASVWGTWDKPGFVHAKSGPQPRRPPPGDGHTETVPDEYNQCVFIRYWTVRKRSWIPRIMKAAAGPHNLPGGGRDGEGSPLEARYDSDSDNASGSTDGRRDDDGSSSTSIDAESDIVIHNTTAVRYLSCLLTFSSILNDPLQDEWGDFDVIADYIFEASRKLGSRHVKQPLIPWS